MRSFEDVLKFWFEEHGQDDWFAGKPEFDQQIAERFSETHAAVAKCDAWEWRRVPAGRLAEIIVLDQFSRQLFRDSGRAFATDGMALVLAQEAVAAGADEEVPLERRMFLYMPYMHSESLKVHAVGLPLFESLGSEEIVGFEKKHLEALNRFGRYPKRNAALNRETTPEEAAYMADGGAF